MTLDEITLPDDLEWVDEFDYSSIVQNMQYGVTGSLFIQESKKQAGRFITLAGSDDMAWLNRTEVVALQAKADTADLEMTLTLSDGRSFNVRFRHGEKAIEVSGVKGFDSLNSGAWFRVTAIRLIEC